MRACACAMRCYDICAQAILVPAHQYLKTARYPDAMAGASWRGVIRLPRFIGDLVYDSGGNVSDSS